MPVIPTRFYWEICFEIRLSAILCVGTVQFSLYSWILSFECIIFSVSEYRYYADVILVYIKLSIQEIFMADVCILISSSIFIFSIFSLFNFIWDSCLAFHLRSDLCTHTHARAHTHSRAYNNKRYRDILRLEILNYTECPKKMSTQEKFW